MESDVRTPVASRARGWRWLGWLASGVAILAACLAFRWYAPADWAAAKPPAGATQPGKAAPAKAAPGKAAPNAVRQATAVSRADTPPGGAPAAKQNPIAAIVNNEPITREQLAQECLLHYGADVLESLVNRTLIESGCQKRNITITDSQIEAEIDRLAAKFQVGKDQWLKLLQKERGIRPERYAYDIVWPTLALRELAKDRLQITREEINQAFESEFGPAVKVRLIAMEDAAKARQIHAQALAKPEEFGALAKKYSQDPNSASAYGLIQPIRRHLGNPQLEAAAFALKKGGISPVIPVGNMHVFVKCEEHIPPATGLDRSKIEPHLIDALTERKLRSAANEVFKQLQDEAVVENVYNDPAKSKQMPGIAAVINGRKVTIRELAEECMERHGPDVLEGTINRRLIDQALRKKNLQVADADIEAEIARAALAMGKVNDRGEPDVPGWIEYVTANENISRDVYIRDEVWPSAALKKLVGNSVKVTAEDLQRGYEANYGPKVQCRAIVLNNPRRAQEVWEKARENPTAKHFGDLAAEYSIEVGSRSLRGEVPPIQKHGGQPLLEKEAFSLSRENPLSGIVQVGGTYVILFYEGRTKPIDTNFEEVKELIFRDIHEKKLRLAMGRTFDELKDNAHVDNFITGELKTPKKVEAGTRDEIPIDPGVPLPRVRGR